MTIVLLENTLAHIRDLPGCVLELTPEGEQILSAQKPHGISYPELLELIFQHERVFCW